MRKPGVDWLSGGLHLLGAAAFSGDEDAVRLLVGTDGAVVDEASPVEGTTATTLAARKGHMGCLRALGEMVPISTKEISMVALHSMKLPKKAI
jgi:hypothetical protein